LLKFGHVLKVLGAYAEDLTIEDDQLRIKAVKLLGAVFAVGNYHTEFSQAFSEFKRRSVDKDPDVRKALINVMQALVDKRGEMGKILMEDEWNYMGGSREAPLLKLVIDIDEGVRKEAVAAVLSACLNNAESVPHSILECVAERVMDKKPAVRKQTMEGLSRLWQKYCAPSDAARLPQSIADRFGSIPSRVLRLHGHDNATRQLVMSCVEDICLSPLNDARTGAEVALHFYSSLDLGARENLAALLKLRSRFCEIFVKFCELREQESADMEVDDGSKNEDVLIQKLSQFFPDPGMANAHFLKLHALKAPTGPKVWLLLKTLVQEPADQVGTLKVQEEVLKRLGPKHPELKFIKTLVGKLSDKFFGADFVRLVLNAVLEDESDCSGAAKKCLALIPELAARNKNLLLSEEDLLDALLTSRCNDAAVCESVLKTIAVAGEQMSVLRKSKSGIATIKDLCTHDSWVVAKYSVRSLVALGCDDRNSFSKLAQQAAGNVNFSIKLPSALRVLSELAKACPEAVEKERDTVSKFVRKKLLQGSWPALAGKKDRQVVIDSKVQGLKLLTVLSLHQEDDGSEDILELCAEIIMKAGEIHVGEGTSKTDKVVLRKTAGSCILRVAKDGGAQSRVSPAIFATLSRLFEDEDKSVKDLMLQKVYKGTAVEHGKLPFRFASLFAMVVHDTESHVVDRGKTLMRNTLLVMSKLKQSTGSEVVSIMPEHILPWLVYLLVVNKEYVDPEEDATQVSQAFKKNFEVFFNNVPTDGQNSAAVQQLLLHIRKCAVPASAAGDASPKIVARNIGLAAEVAERILIKKGWNTKGFASASEAIKIVDVSILCEKGKGKDEHPTEMDTDFKLSPIKASTTAKKAASQKTVKPSKASLTAEIKSPAKSPAKSLAKSPAKSLAKSPAKSPTNSPAKRRQSKAASEEADDMPVDDDDKMRQDDDGAAAFDFDDEEPKRKSGASEHEQQRGRRPDSVGQAPARGKKVSCHIAG